MFMKNMKEMIKLRKLNEQEIVEPLVITFNINIYEHFNHYKTDMTATSITNTIVNQLNRIITKSSMNSELKCLGIIKMKQQCTEIPIGELHIFKDTDCNLFAILYNDQNFNIGNRSIQSARLDLYPYFNVDKDYRWNVLNNLNKEKPHFSKWALTIYNTLFRSVD